MILSLLFLSKLNTLRLALTMSYANKLKSKTCTAFCCTDSQFPVLGQTSAGPTRNHREPVGKSKAIERDSGRKIGTVAQSSGSETSVHPGNTFKPTYKLLCCSTCYKPKNRCQCSKKDKPKGLKGKITLPSFAPHWAVHTTPWTGFPDDTPRDIERRASCLARQNKELLAQAPSAEQFEEQQRYKKRRAQEVNWTPIVEVFKPTHNFPLDLYYNGKTGIKYPKRHHTDSCGIHCPSKTSGYCLYKKMFKICEKQRDSPEYRKKLKISPDVWLRCDKCNSQKHLAFEPLFREEDYGQYRSCGYLPQNGGFPLQTGYFGGCGLGYELTPELVFNHQEGVIQNKKWKAEIVFNDERFSSMMRRTKFSELRKIRESVSGGVWIGFTETSFNFNENKLIIKTTDKQKFEQVIDMIKQLRIKMIPDELKRTDVEKLDKIDDPSIQ